MTSQSKITDLYLEIKKTLSESQSDTAQFTKMLGAFAHHYKYPLSAQLAIYAQRPDATAVAPMEVWNKAMNRWIANGGKGIALIDTGTGGPEIRRVFDVSDTKPPDGGTAEFRIEDYKWQYAPEYEETTLQTLRQSYENTENDLPAAIDKISERLTSEYFEANSETISAFIPYTTGLEFRAMTADSIAYIVRSRCGLENNFPPRHEPAKLTATGFHAFCGAVSASAREVLNKIEFAINEYKNERKTEHERNTENTISSGRGRGLSGSGLGSSGFGNQSLGQDETGIPERTPAADIQPDGLFRDVAGTPASYQHDGGEASGLDAGTHGETRPAAGQQRGLFGVRPAHEQPARESRRDYQKRTDLPGRTRQLGLFDRPQPIPATPELVNGVTESTPKSPASTTARDTEPPETGNQNNYRITDMSLGEGRTGEGQKARFNWNIAAINTLKQIEAENRPATPEEKDTLSRYVGWGGLPQAFDKENAQWTEQYAKLKELLTEYEYDLARGSTPNAHYTSPVVIKAMYDALNRMGYRKGNILEPACGVGNFFGMLPESMNESKLYGIELDSISARISQKLYPDANIQEKAFEKSELPNNAFNVVIGNVPFGSYKVKDDYIHDYFIKESLEKLTPGNPEKGINGGIGILITSTGTADKQSPELRKYMAERARIIDIIRLPNNAFEKNAGATVPTDIIFFEKRPNKIDISAADEKTKSFIHLEYTSDGVPINGYLANNPQKVLGRMINEGTMYGGKRTTCVPFENANLADQLQTAVRAIESKSSLLNFDNIAEQTVSNAIPANPDVKNFSYTVVDNTVYFRENSLMYPVTGKRNKVLERIKGMTALRDCTRELINYQLENYSDDSIKAKQAELSNLYDSFVKQHGHINLSANKQAFNADAGYYLLTGLERKDKNGEIIGKADIFTKRTIAGKRNITAVDTSNEALIVSIAEKNGAVDLDYMSKLTGFDKEKIINDLQGAILQNPDKLDDSDPFAGYETREEYLSGNVRRKLELARIYANDRPQFQVNVDELEKVQPREIESHEIAVRLGATWIDKKYVEEFLKETLGLPAHAKMLVKYSGATGKWQVSGHESTNSILKNVTYGTDRINAYAIIEETLNLRDDRITDVEENARGSKISVLNVDETTKARQKQDLIKETFAKWIFQDPDRAQEITKLYNEKFDSNASRIHDGSHLTFPGMNPEHELRPHQRNAVARSLYGNTLLAHEVGTGKTFIYITAAMEKKRLGLCQKTLISVPKHLTKQVANDFMKLYPGANILVATSKDFTEENRKRFSARMATGDYDAVIIGHTQLEKIPLSSERQERLIKQEIQTITDSLQSFRYALPHEKRNNRFTVKQLEITKKSLEARLEKLLKEEKKDNVLTFEQCGFDNFIGDEAHYWKNLYFHTKMRGNIKGISNADAQKTIDFLLKTQYLNEITKEKGLMLATGTPVSNSIVELHAMLRYMSPKLLNELEIETFDKFVSTFFDTETNLEPAPEGGGHQMVTRLLPRNTPEIVKLFRTVADIQTAEGLGIERPEAERDTIVSKRTEIQAELINELARRASRIRSGAVSKEVDNMLLVTNEGRKIGLDQRLINPLLPDDPRSKVNSCVKTVLDTWKETEKDRLTQLVFCDLSTPTEGKGFNIYDDVKEKLTAQGVPKEEIAFIHDAATEEQKEKLFEKVRNGEVRILLGSTDKMGAGMNVQDKLIAIHHLSCPYRPSDLAQRDGRGERQGNENEKIKINYYVTEDTFDQYLYHLVKTKWDMIRKIVTDKVPEQRHYDSLDDISITYAQVQAVSTGNPKMKEYVELEVEIDRLDVLERGYNHQKSRLNRKINTDIPATIENIKKYIEELKADIDRLEKNTLPNEFSPLTIDGTTYHEKKDAGQAIIDACRNFPITHKNIRPSEPVKIGQYRGFDLAISFHQLDKSFKATFRGEGSRIYDTALGADPHGNITRLNNVLDGIPSRLEQTQQTLEKTNKELESAKIESEKPSPHIEKLNEAIKRYEELGKELDIDNQENSNATDSEAPEGLNNNDESDSNEMETNPEIKEEIYNVTGNQKNDRIIISTIPKYGFNEPKQENTNNGNNIKF